MRTLSEQKVSGMGASCMLVAGRETRNTMDLLELDMIFKGFVGSGSC